MCFCTIFYFKLFESSIAGIALDCLSRHQRNPYCKQMFCLHSVYNNDNDIKMSSVYFAFFINVLNPHWNLKNGHWFFLFPISGNEVREITTFGLPFHQLPHLSITLEKSDLTTQNLN